MLNQDYDTWNRIHNPLAGKANMMEILALCCVQLHGGVCGLIECLYLQSVDGVLCRSQTDRASLLRYRLLELGLVGCLENGGDCRTETCL